MGASSTHNMFGGGARPLQRGHLWVRAEVRGKEGLGWERGAQAWAVNTRLGVTRLSK